MQLDIAVRTNAVQLSPKPSLGPGAIASVLFLIVVLLVAFWSILEGGNAAEIDRSCIGGCAPGASGHWLGTDSLGRDVWLQLSQGAFTALAGGLSAAGLSFLMGYALGAGAAWGSRGGRKVSWWVLAQAVLLACIAGYWIVFKTTYQLWLSFPLVFLVVLLAFSIWLGGTKAYELGAPSWTKRGIRSDKALLFFTEVISSVPALLLLLALAAMAFRPGLWQLVLIFVFVRWTSFAVQALQEVRGVLNTEYITAAYHGATPSWRLLSRHVLPNALPPLLVKSLLTVGGFILVEGTFSYLGLGLPVEQASWGRVLAQAQQVNGGWWLWLFPGILLIGSILSLQVIGRALRQPTRH